jgi:hypothetical protein
MKPRRTRDPLERLMNKRAVDADGCWRFAGALNAAGYGVIGINKKTVYAHRLAYEAFVGPISVGLTLDHLCRNRACFNPAHLEPVTRGENVRRGRPFAKPITHCKRGHEFTPENTYVIPGSGSRVCVTCRRERTAA